MPILKFYLNLITAVVNMVTDSRETASTKEQGLTSSADVVPPDSNVDERFHFVERGKEIGESSSSQGSIDGYDPELMSGRNLLTAEEEKKLLRKIDWRLMTLCSIIFMFKNLDSTNVRFSTSWRFLPTYPSLEFECFDHEQRHQSKHSHPAWVDFK